MTRKICVVTGTRAEYGLLRWVIAGIRDAPGLELQQLVTGTHLSRAFGNTVEEIERDGLPIARRVDILVETDGEVDVAKSMAAGLSGFSEAFAVLRPDVIVLLGDRFEILAAAAAATTARIPIAHLHGGELSEGSYDDAFRHAITKMAHLHFVAAEEYAKRVIQLGEDPSRVFVVGGLGLDSIARLRLMERPELEAALGARLGAKNLLVTFHPATLEAGSATAQTEQLLDALGALKDTNLFFTMPNADVDSAEVADAIDRFVASHSNAESYVSLGQLRYFSLLRQVDGVVGNSSSGLIEAPALGKGTVNIGSRQRGRLKAASVIDCEPESSSIAAAIQTLYSPPFRARLSGAVNPYGDGGASEKIVKKLSNVPLDGLLQKSFHDL